MPRSASNATLYVVGTPLHDGEKLTLGRDIFLAAAMIIGESRKGTTYRLSSFIPNQNDERFYFLDGIKERDWTDLKARLGEVAQKGGTVCLLSDTGMPILFDPGKDVFEECRRLGFAIQSLPGPTSWGTACALSGWEPPFEILGFLPREKTDRQKGLAGLAKKTAHVVLLETPYRFAQLVDELSQALPPKRRIFLAWEIGSPGELLWWGPMEDLKKHAKAAGLEKGEFVLVVGGAS